MWWVLLDMFTKIVYCFVSYSQYHWVRQEGGRTNVRVGAMLTSRYAGFWNHVTWRNRLNKESSFTWVCQYLFSRKLRGKKIMSTIRKYLFILLSSLSISCINKYIFVIWCLASFFLPHEDRHRTFLHKTLSNRRTTAYHNTYTFNL